MRTITQEAIVSANIVSIGKRTPRDAAQDAAELCRLANSLNRLKEIACNFGLTKRQERGRYKPYLPPFCGLVGTNAMRHGNCKSEDIRTGTRRQACRRVPVIPFPLNHHKAESIPLSFPPLTHFL